MLESCRRSSDVNFHFWLSAASSTNVRCRALRAAWTISVSSKSLMLRRIGTWKLIGARSIRNVIRTCASCLPRASASMRATVILNLLIPSLGLVVQAAHKHGRCPRYSARCSRVGPRTDKLGLANDHAPGRSVCECIKPRRASDGSAGVFARRVGGGLDTEFEPDRPFTGQSRVDRQQTSR